MTTMRQFQTELDERFSEPGAIAIEWEDTLGMLEQAQLGWLSTVRADGRPHVTPLVPVWLDGSLYFTTGPGEQKALNLSRNDAVVLTTGCDAWEEGADVVVEGSAQRVTDQELLARLADEWGRKWDGRWRFEPRDGAFEYPGGVSLVFQVTPRKVLVFGRGTFTHTRHLAR